MFSAAARPGVLQIRNLLHILVELPWTIYLPLFLLLKMVLTAQNGHGKTHWSALRYLQM